MWCVRDAISDLALHFLGKLKILVVQNIERDDIEFISRVSSCGVGRTSDMTLLFPLPDCRLPAYSKS